MLTTLGALVPVFAMIALGWLLRRRNLAGSAFWPDAERLVYWVLFPSLLFTLTAGSDLSTFRVLPMASALVLATALTAGLAVLAKPYLTLSGPAFSSVFQGSIRANSYVGLAGAGALYGEAGLAIVGIVVLIVVSLVNVLSVLALLHYANGRGGWREMLSLVLRNPLIVACLAGFAINVAGLSLPPVLVATLEILSEASLTLGLLCVGAGLELTRIGQRRDAVLAACALKLLIMPGLTALTCWLFAVEGVTAAVAVLYTAVPVSASSYVLARELGGDGALMAELIALSTIGSVLSLPLVLALLT